jgi:hypothetical protein
MNKKSGGKPPFTIAALPNCETFIVHHSIIHRSAFIILWVNMCQPVSLKRPLLLHGDKTHETIPCFSARIPYCRFGRIGNPNNRNR